jgi:dienelactone hydrolase
MGIRAFDRAAERAYFSGNLMRWGYSRDEVSSLGDLSDRLVRESGRPHRTAAALADRMKQVRQSTSDFRGVKRAATAVNALINETLPKDVIREVAWVPVPIGARRVSIEATIWRPNEPGPFPLIVMSHGGGGGVGNLHPYSQEARQVFKSVAGADFEPLSRWFVERGYAVIVPVRRGYGDSQGRFAERVKNGNEARYVEAGRSASRDLRAAIEFMRKKPYVDPDRLILAGQSAGAFSSLALASQGMRGLRCIIAFAPGRGALGSGRRTPGQGRFWKEDELLAAYRLYGRKIGVDTLWLQSRNDTFVPPRMGIKSFRAFRESGGRGEFRLVGRYRTEGHLFFDDPKLWGTTVESFLERRGLPFEPRSREEPVRAASR